MEKNISTYCITGSAFYSSNPWLSQSICFINKDTYEHSLNYLGLADLGQSRGYENDDPYDYNHDGDNHLDICLNLSTSPEYLENEINIELLCDETLENSLLYPPKGKPFSCKNQQITLTKNDDKYLLSWEINWESNKLKWIV